MTDPPRSDRVAYSDSVAFIYDALKEENGSTEVSPFRTFKDIFMFAVFLGFRKGVRQKLPAGPKKTIRLDVFTREDKDLLYSVALVDTQSVEILESPANIVAIIEEYAQVGIYDLQSELLNKGGRALWNLVSLVSVQVDT